MLLVMLLFTCLLLLLVFSSETVDPFIQMEQEQGDQVTSLFMKKILADQTMKKVQDEALQKQQDSPKANHRKNEIHIKKEKMKKSAHNQRYVENLFTLSFLAQP